jgi:hypothetical protein
MLHQIMLFGFSVSGTPTNAPIDKPLQQLVDVLMGTGILLCLIAFIAGAAMKAVGGQSGNYGAAQRGQSMLMWAAGGTALIAGAGAIITWFWGIGALV